MGMRIRGKTPLKSSATEENDNPLGFSLIFENSKTYDLDEITTGKSRTSSDAALLIEVKDIDKITSEIANKYTERIISTLDEASDGTFSDKIMGIVANAYLKYSNDESLENVSKHVNSEVREYLYEIFSENEIEFTITVDSVTNEIAVMYDFLSDESMRNALGAIYSEYAEALNDAVRDIPEGGLAIEGKALEKIQLTSDDYSRYLL